MFGFGKKNNDTGIVHQEDPERKRIWETYGLSKSDHESLLNSESSSLSRTFGSPMLDHVLEFNAPDTFKKLNCIDYRTEQIHERMNDIEEALTWKGRYLELLDEHKAILKRYDDLVKELAQKVRDSNER